MRWFEYPELMEEELMQLDEAQRPDVILTNFTSRNDYYQYMRDGMFYDLTDWFEQEAMYTDGQYYNAVLQAGQYKERQYIVPILFNISTIMGAGRIWNELGLHPEAAQDYEDILDALIYVQADQKIDQTACQFVEASPEYLPCILYSASGEQWIDYEKEAVHLDETVFRKMCIFYQYFVKEQLSEEDIIQGETLHWTNAKNLRIIRSICNEIQLNAFLGDMGCIVEGGGGFQPCLHSAAAQAWYYESRYRDMEEEFMLYALPSESGGTSAQISYFGAVMEGTAYPEAAFDFLHYLMDEEVPPFFGLSVNQENLLEQLDYMTTTSYHVRPGTQIVGSSGTVLDSKEDYIIQPMSEETKEKILKILDEIDHVSLPNWPVYAVLENELQDFAKGEISQEEAYQNTIDNLEEYRKN